jgi:hypothetical protein
VQVFEIIHRWHSAIINKSGLHSNLFVPPEQCVCVFVAYLSPVNQSFNQSTSSGFSGGDIVDLLSVLTIRSFILSTLAVC